MMPPHLPDLLAVLISGRPTTIQAGPFGSQIHLASYRLGLLVRVCPLTMGWVWFGLAVGVRAGEA